MKRIASTVATAFGLCAAGALTACGGGGGSSAPAPAAAPTNLSSAPGAAALNAYFQAPQSVTLNATNGGNSFSALLQFAPNAGTAMFEGVNVQDAADQVTLSENGTMLGVQVQTDYYTLNPYQDVGSVSSSGTQYTVVQSFGPIPATISVGQSGPFETATIYHDSTKVVVDGTQTTNYSVSAISPSALSLCLNNTITANAGNPDGLTDGSQTTCFRVDASGNATLYKVTVSVSGLTLTFQ
jgi:hypothetical protein